MGATKKTKAVKQLRTGKKMEAQRPLTVSDISITKHIDASSTKPF